MSLRPPGRGGWLGVAARVRAGHSRNWDRVWRCVISGKVAELDPLCTFVTDVLTWSGTHLDICCPECQPGAQACETANWLESSI